MELPKAAHRLRALEARIAKLERTVAVLSRLRACRYDVEMRVELAKLREVAS
jgi:hypothetical protein